ncbi:gamma-glutamyltransferase [Nafulsella turpanensis]|uniref:gamma-glutamyltransferase n=1 Tax=Nafulsella turpanensis TaxID=1265690 RepID=UPI00034A884F|nr:gamma-glutamyltransferase [Nafulsella turpanensis]
MKIHHSLIFTFLTLFALLLQSCNSKPEGAVLIVEPEFGKVVTAGEAMVVCAHPEATRVGVDILEKGGNAIDAMVGTHFTLAVVYPTAGNIGGGGFMVYRQDDGETFTLDFREEAPGLASRTMYQNKKGEVIEGLSLYGHLAAGVPGSVDGMLRAHERFGKLPLAELLEPAIQLAENGFAITAQQAEKFNRYREDFLQYNPGATDLPLVKEGEWKAGDELLLPTLAATLRRIQESGRAGFYEGETARLLVEEMERGGGIITAEDLLNYEAIWREPVEGMYKDVKVISMPPPSSGGIALIQLMNMSEEFPLDEWGFHSVSSVHTITEMERRVYAERAEHLGDPDFWDVPQEELLDPDYLQDRVESIDPEQATPSSEIQALSLAAAHESEQTTHFSIVDTEGNAVSVTTTINASYGSKVFVQGAGFLLNNEMDDFSVKPGYPNLYGLVGGEANAIQPGKRMLSSMTPTILERDGDLLMVVGSPGGSTIITSVYQTILNVVTYDMPLEEAVAAKRYHHQWLPDKIFMEEGAFRPAVADSLREIGHELEVRGPIGRVDAILVQPDGALKGVGDPRGDDWAGGF